jgi:dTDP-4-dehydrorhamnose reductase
MFNHVPVRFGRLERAKRPLTKAFVRLHIFMILLLGATGYLGRAFAAELRKRQIEFIPLSRQAVDYTRFDVLFNYVRNSKPTLLINAAGRPVKLDAEDCEASRAEMLEANTLLPQTVGRVCYLSRTHWAHISSSAIFDGAKVSRNGSVEIERDLGRPEICKLFDSEPEKFHGYTEADAPNCSFRSPPCNFYSGTKALAEEALGWSGEGYLWRPGVLFDEFDNSRNYLSKIQSDGRIRNSVNSFSHRGDFVRACVDLWERRSPFGAYNIVNPGAASVRQIAGSVQSFLSRKSSFEFSENDSEIGGTARHTGSILDSSKLLSTGIRMRPLVEAMEDSLRKWQPTPQNHEWLGANTSGSK